MSDLNTKSNKKPKTNSKTNSKINSKINSKTNSKTNSKKTKSKKTKSKTRIAYLGWGSLLWDSTGLKVYEWERSNLKLPLEFSRASDGGFGRLTLVIDTKNGTENRVWIGETAYKNINTAIKAIRKREHSKNPKAIAYIDVKKGTKRVTNTPEHIVKRIEDYAKKNGYDVLIWTDLASNWVDIKFCPFTNENAYNFFHFLPIPMQIRVLTYIYQASRVSQVKTKFSEYFLKKIKNQ